jgi:hypothetical protein
LGLVVAIAQNQKRATKKEAKIILLLKRFWTQQSHQDPHNEAL